MKHTDKCIAQGLIVLRFQSRLPEALPLFMKTYLQHAPPPSGGFLQCELPATAINPWASIIGVKIDRWAMLSISGGGWALPFLAFGGSQAEVELAGVFLAL